MYLSCSSTTLFTDPYLWVVDDFIRDVDSVVREVSPRLVCHRNLNKNTLNEIFLHTNQMHKQQPYSSLHAPAESVVYGQLHSDVPSSDDSVVGPHLCKQRRRELLDHHASNLLLLVLKALAVVVSTLQDSPSLVT